MKQYAGGYVKEPKIGIHKNITVLDFRNLYPSIIVTYNIDPSTLNKECKKKVMVPGFKRWFCQDSVAPIPKRIKKILEERWKLKEQLKKKYDAKLAKKEKQLKLAANIAYGYFGYRESPYYNIECAEAISAFGRNHIQKVIREAEKAGFIVIYADTDSVFLSGNKSKVVSFLKKINKSLPGIIKLEYRGVYEKGLFVSTKTGKGAKKKYALIDKKGDLLIRGFESRREDWCKLAKDLQKEILKFVLLGKTDKAVSYARNVINKLREHKVKLSDLVISVQLTKPIEKYKAIGPHVMAAKKMKRLGKKLETGMMIKFVITKGAGSISERAEPAEFANIKEIDDLYYIDHQLVPSILRVLSIFGIEEETLKKISK